MGSVRANRYAEQVLGELEGRLKELGQVVMAGRRELVRLQVPAAAGATDAPKDGPGPGQGGGGSQSKRRRVANTLRQLAG